MTIFTDFLTFFENQQNDVYLSVALNSAMTETTKIYEIKNLFGIFWNLQSNSILNFSFQEYSIKYYNLLICKFY